MRAGITVLAAILAAGSFSAFGANTKHIKHAKKPVPSNYVVVLEERIIDDPESILEELAKKHDVRFKRHLAPLLKAGHFQMNRGQAEAVLADERVAGVWEDAEVDLAATVVPRSWNLDRVDNRLAPRLDASYHYCSTGRGVRAYIVDTGIWGSHDEFSNPDPITGLSRVPLGYDRDATNHSNDPLCNRSLPGDTFLYGGSHGTAVASVLGGRTLGVAPDVTLVPVRVLNCESKGSFRTSSSASTGS